MVSYWFYTEYVEKKNAANGCFRLQSYKEKEQSFEKHNKGYYGSCCIKMRWERKDL